MEPTKTVELFMAWFVKPLELLDREIGADAGWVALMVTLPLYERLIRAKLQNSDNKVMFDWMAHDLLITKEQAEDFWDVLRHGLAHQAMPKLGHKQPRQKRKKSSKAVIHFILSADGPPTPVFGEYEGKLMFWLDPMKFAKRILNLCISNSELIAADKVFPFAYVSPINIEQLRTYQVAQDKNVLQEDESNHPVLTPYIVDEYTSSEATLLDVDLERPSRTSQSTRGTMSW